jgi:hypothetical protein
MCQDSLLNAQTYWKMKVTEAYNFRWINTRVEYGWRDDKLVEVLNEGYWYSGDMALCHNTPDRSQVHFKFWEANATTQVAAVDTAPTLSVDTDYVFQIEIENIGDEITTNDAYGFQYNLAAAGWVDITASSVVVQTAAASGLTNTTATVSGDNLGSAKLFTAGEECTDGVTAAIQINSTDTTPEYTIFKFGFTIVSAEVVDLQSLAFRPIYDPSGTPTQLDTYGVNATSTVSDPDTTAPVLTTPTGTKTNEDEASGTVITDEGNGTLYWYTSTSATPPSIANHKDGTSSSAFGSQTVTVAGTENITVTGLDAATTYYNHYLHTDAAATPNDSNQATSASFTTDAQTTIALSGTVTASVKEADIVTGGKTIILTLTGNTWKSTGASFDAERQNIIDGLSVL